MNRTLGTCSPPATPAPLPPPFTINAFQISDSDADAEDDNSLQLRTKRRRGLEPDSTVKRHKKNTPSYPVAHLNAMFSDMEEQLLRSGIKHDREELVRVLYSLWDLGPGWHLDVDLEDNCGVHWCMEEETGRLTTNDLRRICMRLNREVNNQVFGTYYPQTMTRGPAVHLAFHDDRKVYKLDRNIYTTIQRLCEEEYDKVITCLQKRDQDAKKQHEIDYNNSIRLTNFTAEIGRERDRTMEANDMLKACVAQLEEERATDHHAMQLEKLLQEAERKNSELETKIQVYNEHPAALFAHITQVITSDKTTRVGRERVKEQHARGIAMLDQLQALRERWDTELARADELEKEAKAHEERDAAEHARILSELPMLKESLVYAAGFTKRLDLSSKTVGGGTFEGLNVTKSAASIGHAIEACRKKPDQISNVTRLREILNDVAVLTYYNGVHGHGGLGRDAKKEIRDRIGASWKRWNLRALLYKALMDGFGASCALFIAKNVDRLRPLIDKTAKERHLLKTLALRLLRLRNEAVPERSYGFRVHESIFQNYLTSMVHSKPDLAQQTFKNLCKAIEAEELEDRKQVEREKGQETEGQHEMEEAEQNEMVTDGQNATEPEANNATDSMLNEQ
ncbi:hypothetical protein HDU89_001709 [Geranomyces variabilis]|nr:hypothetical protein HDU89_001709 [Geranomyces variabilis]